MPVELEPPHPMVVVLPLYLELYDRVVPQYRAEREAFVDKVTGLLAGRHLDVGVQSVCCTREEVERALARLGSGHVDLLATLHLAYSPSLEAVEPLARFPAPLALLDTTVAERFGETATRDDMFANHGIHGVQDLASVLRRVGRPYSVITGHWEDEAFLDEVESTARGCAAAHALRGCTTVLIGEPFVGMGDFAVGFEELEARLGPKVRGVGVAELAARTAEVTDAELEAEARDDARWFDLSGVSADVLRESNRVGLGVRRLLDEARARAFSMNFQAFDRAVGTPTVPFLEASKAMARQLGYAGEGDVLTASFIGALAGGFRAVTFTEMFCPDWHDNAIFMSHMGECNPAMAASTRPLRIVEKDYAFGDVANPAVAVFALEPGPATLANIAPGPGGTFSIIAARVEVLDRGPSPNFPDVPHYWIRPRNGSLRDFLRRYSELGGTHHLALVLGDQMVGLERMAEVLHLEFASL